MAVYCPCSAELTAGATSCARPAAAAKAPGKDRSLNASSSSWCLAACKCEVVLQLSTVYDPSLSQGFTPIQHMASMNQEKLVPVASPQHFVKLANHLRNLDGQPGLHQKCCVLMAGGCNANWKKAQGARVAATSRSHPRCCCRWRRVPVGHG